MDQAPVRSVSKFIAECDAANRRKAQAPKGTFPSEFLTGRIRYRATGEFRAPKAGEYFLSGAKIMAYRAPNDLSGKYWIAEPVPGSSTHNLPQEFIDLLKAATQSRIKGNPYAVPEVRAALECVAKARGIKDKYDALSGL
jgi:hypothetical protein